jgi:hypothetical protein
VTAPRCHAAATRPVHKSRTQRCDAAHFLCPASCHTLQHLLTRRPSATAGNRLRNLCAPTSQRAKGNLSTYTEQRTPALIGSHIIPPVDTTPHKRENRQSVRWHGGGREWCWTCKVARIIGRKRTDRVELAESLCDSCFSFCTSSKGVQTNSLSAPLLRTCGSISGHLEQAH